MDDMGEAPLVCPDPALWIQVAAGTEAPELSAKLLEHAADCTACAIQLREAISVVTDEGNPIEERFVRELTSSQPVWREEMVQRLTGEPSSLQPMPRARPAGWRRHWLARAAAVIIVAVGLGSLAIWRFGPPSQRSTQMQTARNATAQPQPMVASLVLEPGTFRGLEGQRSLQLTAATSATTLTLLFVQPPPVELSIKLVNSLDREIWTRDLRMTNEDINRLQVQITIPANLLVAGDYQVHVTNRGSESVSDYAFRVTR